MYYATSRIYVNRDYTQVVPEGSPEAAFLLASPGKPVDMALARRLGLLNPPASPASPAASVDDTGEAAPAKTPRRRVKAADPADVPDTPLARHPFPSADPDPDDEG